ncbi:hypothetical protein Q9L58_010936, partial [Maublancomyces gigas]
RGRSTYGQKAMAKFLHYLRTYEEHEDGRLENLRIYPADWYHTYPVIGDTLTHQYGSKVAHFIVVRRHYVEAPTTKGWAIVVKRIAEEGSMKTLMEAWIDDDEFWASVEPDEDE